MDGDLSPFLQFYGHGLAEHILADDLSLTSTGDDVLAHLGEILLQLQISRELIGQTTHQTAANPGDLCRVEGQVLLLGHFYGDQVETIHELGTTKLPSATTDTTDHLGLIPHPDLAHLNPHSEFGGQIFDELSEIDSLFSREVEEGFGAA